ncbi:M15 family metallopeptidase [Cronbergia sp. UHCC 0137]|uniref:M15 family metallopeptidase n=1 Tax=Cronbergia sp. UHCC 0137 TaxID=3110239 RepID=UPI002B1EEB5F|nr:M15 family metallopeptidase [Cronbergia sp. UHCC 0137]MEA5618618.1 M15 family metallopeptidase [Cronbergia sp. UHCC 0137]
MNKAGFSGKPQNSSTSPGDDIPVALRDTADAGSPGRWRVLILVFGAIGGFILLAVASGFFFFVTSPKKTTEAQPILNSTPEENNDHVLGHFVYPEAPESELVAITADGRIRMRKSAAEKYQAMVQAARSKGVILVSISGFRSIKQQEQLFFDIGAQRNQTPAQRAALSAPPGHSEHHTGYAVDIGDGTVPATNLQTNFDNTKAFQWLEGNAARFGFELSFPKDNSQGVSYEPWHWRFVGDRDSLETFYKAKNLNPTPTSQSTP